MDTGLIRVPLTELRTNDEQTVGSEYEHKGKKYRWVKNIGDTALPARGACLQVLTGTEGVENSKVVSLDAAGASTAIIDMAAGMPMSAIVASGGSGSACFGWVQFAGPARVSEMHSTQAIVAGGVLVPNTAATAAGGWGYLGPTTGVSLVGMRRAVAMQSAVARSSGFGLCSANVNLQCA